MVDLHNEVHQFFFIVNSCQVMNIIRKEFNFQKPQVDCYDPTTGSPALTELL